MDAPRTMTPVATPAAARTAGSDIAAALKDAGLAALVTFGLSIPIIAYKTDQGPSNELILTPRWGLVLILCVLAFGVRLAMRLIGVPWLEARRAQSRKEAVRTAAHEPTGVSRRFTALAVPFFLGIALSYPLLAALAAGGLNESRYWVDLGILILTYVMLGWGLNIVVGLAGLLDLGYVAFYAVGAYSYALLATTFGLSFWICLPIAGILAALWGIMLGFPVLRLRGDYLAIVTLAFGEIMRLVLINWVDLTNGGAGISSIPRVSFFGLPFNADENGFAATFGLPFNAMHRIVFLYYLILALALITNFVTLRLRKLPIGRAWEALREDEIACRSLGINTRNTKLTAFAMGAMFGGFAGSFFAVRQGFISPESFNFLESAIILAIVVLGGMGSQLGVAIAAVAMVGGPELLRNLGFLKRGVRSGLRPERIPPAPLRPRHGGDDGVASARPDFGARALHRAERTQGHLRLACEGGARLMRWRRDPVLTVEHLTMRFGGLVAVNDLSFEAGRGDITALIGPNGAGKTTVFNCITGFYKPTEGMLTLRHQDGPAFLLERLPGHRIAWRAKVARTFQNIRLFSGMTVLENLLVAQHNPLMIASGFTFLGVLGIRGYAAAERRAVEKATAWLDKIRLLDRADDPAGDLPYGAQRRLEIARAMCTDPALLCLDEPAAGLNPRESPRTQRTAAVDPGGPRHVDPAHRARHVGRDGDFRPRGRARLRHQDFGRRARRGPKRPARHRGLSRRRGRGSGRSRGGGGSVKRTKRLACVGEDCIGDGPMRQAGRVSVSGYAPGHAPSPPLR